MTVVNNFAGAVTDLRSIAAKQFSDASAIVHTGPPAEIPETAPAKDREAGKKDQAKYAKAQSELAAAFKQLGDVDHTEKEHDGYADVVQLMKTTAATAFDVCLKIGTIMNALPVQTSTTQVIDFQPQQIAQIEALTGVLNALAALSPAALWQKTPEAAAAK